jgi:hypothetical protein
MLQWRKTLSLLDMAFLVDHISHPHSSRCIGIAQKNKHLLQISRQGQCQTLLSALIDWVASVTLFLMP